MSGEVALGAHPGEARSPLKAVALPTEHGGWSLTAEPVLLGLLVAGSGAGVALGAAAVVAFMARTPLKVVLVDRWRGRWLARSALAARVFAIEAVMIGALVAIAALSAARPFWIPLFVAAPLVAVELWFDMRSRSRRLIPELAGTIGMGSIAAAIALAGGTSGRVAAGLWCVIAACSGAAIPFVRTQLHRARGKAAQRATSDLAQLLSVGVVAVAWALDAAPGAAVLIVAVAAAANVINMRRSPPRAVVLGMQQMVLGLTVVLVTGLAVLAP